MFSKVYSTYIVGGSHYTTASRFTPRLGLTNSLLVTSDSQGREGVSGLGCVAQTAGPNRSPLSFKFPCCPARSSFGCVYLVRSVHIIFLHSPISEVQRHFNYSSACASEIKDFSMRSREQEKEKANNKIKINK